MGREGKPEQQTKESLTQRRRVRRGREEGNPRPGGRRRAWGPDHSAQFSTLFGLGGWGVGGGGDRLTRGRGRRCLREFADRPQGNRHRDRLRSNLLLYRNDGRV